MYTDYTSNLKQDYKQERIWDNGAGRKVEKKKWAEWHLTRSLKQHEEQEKYTDVSKKRYFQNDKDEQILPAMRIMKDLTVTISIIWDL